MTLKQYFEFTIGYSKTSQWRVEDRLGAMVEDWTPLNELLEKYGDKELLSVNPKCYYINLNQIYLGAH